MNGTPETDALGRELHNPRVLQDLYSEIMEWAAMCGRYKQERDELRSECKALWVMVDTEKKKTYTALRERDEAREAIKIVAQDKDKMIERVIVERNSAREAFETLRSHYADKCKEVCGVTKERDEALEDAKHWEELYRTVSTY